MHSLTNADIKSGSPSPVLAEVGIKETYSLIS